MWSAHSINLMTMFKGTRYAQMIEAGRGRIATGAEVTKAYSVAESAKGKLYYSARQVIISYNDKIPVDKFHMENVDYHHFNDNL